MFKSLNLKDFAQHAANGIEVMMTSWRFFKENKLWKGFLTYKWVALCTILISIVFSYFFIHDMGSYLFSEQVSNPINEAGFIDDAISEQAKEDNKKTSFSGGSKFLLLIVLELIIFFFSMRTLEILSGKRNKANFKVFWKAELRMVKVMFKSFIQGTIIQFGLYIILSIFGLTILNGFLMFFVYASFMGMAFLDNFNEQYGMTIKESEYVAKQHFGAAFVLGIATSLLLMIPIVGPIVTPIFGAISANVYGYRFKLQENIAVSGLSEN